MFSMNMIEEIKAHLLRPRSGPRGKKMMRASTKATEAGLRERRKL